MFKPKDIKVEIWDREKKRMSKPCKIFTPIIFWQDGSQERTSAMMAFLGEGVRQRYEFRRSTGCKDKYGFTMFEWDIVKAHGSIGLVAWNDDLALFELQVKAYGEDGSMTIYSRQDANGFYVEREIIGNIFQTPEKLLDAELVETVKRKRIEK